MKAGTGVMHEMRSDRELRNQRDSNPALRGLPFWGDWRRKALGAVRHFLHFGRQRDFAATKLSHFPYNVRVFYFRASAGLKTMARGGDVRIARRSKMSPRETRDNELR